MADPFSQPSTSSRNSGSTPLISTSTNQSVAVRNSVTVPDSEVKVGDYPLCLRLPRKYIYTTRRSSKVNYHEYDRYIPFRTKHTHARWVSLNQNGGQAVSQTEKGRDTPYVSILRNELLNIPHWNGDLPRGSRESRNLFSYSSPNKHHAYTELGLYPLSNISVRTQKLLSSPQTRKISSTPCKKIVAPNLEDNFYLNVLDWSAKNIVSVGLDDIVHIGAYRPNEDTLFSNLLPEFNHVTSVAWNDRGNMLAVGSDDGYIEVWDVEQNFRISTLVGHNSRVGVLAWNGDLLCSGSQDSKIILRDTRTASSVKTLMAHTGEVCGLKWSPDKAMLASGADDDIMHVWDMHYQYPVHSMFDHAATIKAIAWSPHQRGLLASGGGSADRSIKFFNTITSLRVKSVDTGSQVCNLAWSKHSSEFVSTHGYSENEILVWKYPSLQQVTKLTAHERPVSYLAMSPDGETIVTGAGDERLFFWKIFNKDKKTERKSALNLYGGIR